MTYTVKYKKTNSFFWKRLKNVQGDGILDLVTEQSSGKIKKSVLPFRWFLLVDKSRIEIPMDGMLFQFCKNRFYSIKENIEKETGQKVRTN